MKLMYALAMFFLFAVAVQADCTWTDIVIDGCGGEMDYTYTVSSVYPDMTECDCGDLSITVMAVKVADEVEAASWCNGEYLGMGVVVYECQPGLWITFDFNFPDDIGSYCVGDTWSFGLEVD